MKGDFSRAAFDYGRYSRVLAQQGRVQLDADWNEQQGIVDYRLRTALGDVFGHGQLVGRAVVPQASPGFGVHLHTGAVFPATQPPKSTGALDAARSFAIEAWIDPDAATAKDPRTIVAACAPATDASAPAPVVAHLALDTSGCVLFEMRDAQGNVQRITSVATLRSDGYSLVTAVFTGDALELWIDGDFDRRTAALAGEQHASLQWSIGAGPSGDSAFAGSIERIRVLGGRRFASEIGEEFHRVSHARNELGDRIVTVWRASHETGAQLRHDLCLGPGRCYVDGLLCSSQVHRLLAVPAHADSAAPERMLVFLDVWERYVSAFEEPSLRDPALGGLDTTGRLRTMASAYMIALQATPQGMLEFLAALDHDRGQIAVDVGEKILQDNRLYRYEVHAGGPAASSAPPSDAVTVELLRPDDTSTAGDRRKLRLPPGVAQTWECGQFLQLIDANGRPTETVLQITSRANDDPSGKWMAVDAVPPGLVGSVCVRPIASMLWSADNGYAVFGVDRIAATAAESTTIDLFDEAGRAALLNVGDVVVITWEERVENFEAGIVTTIASISTDIPGTISVVVPIGATPLGGGATLRRWDGLLPVTARADGNCFATGDLTVRFSGSGTFRPGDYWVAQIRPDADTPLEWRYDTQHVAAFLPPFGIAHVYAPLAFVELDEGTPRVVSDFRHPARSVGDFTSDIHDMLHEFAWPQQPAPVEHHHHHHVEEHPVRETVVEHVVETLPEGAFVLSRHALNGYERAGSVVEARVEHLTWESLGHGPQSGSAQAVELDASIYVLYTDGALWKRDVNDTRNPWEPCAALPAPVSEAAICVTNGALVVLGGVDARGRVRRAVHAYDPRADEWSALAPMRVARSRAAATGDAHRMLVFGGTRRTFFGWRYASRTVEEYDVARKRWRRLEPMSLRRSAAAAVRTGASALLVGGETREALFARSWPCARVDRYVPATKAWSYVTELSDTRVNPRAAVVGGELLVLGDGSTGDRVDLATGEVRAFAAKARNDFGMAVFEGVVYAIGGIRYDGTPADDVRTCTVIDRYHVLRPAPRTPGNE